MNLMRRADKVPVENMVSTIALKSGGAVVEAALQDSGLFRALLDRLDAGVYIVDHSRRILYWNSGAEQITGYLSQDVAGQFCHADLLMHCDESGAGMCGRKCPLLGVMNDGKPRDHTFFLRHRHGHRLPVHVRSLPVLDESGVVIGAVEVFDEIRVASRRESEALNDAGCVDQVTGLPNRQYGAMRVNHALDALHNFHLGFGWLRVELDGTKELEHRFGHGMIDAAARMIARTLDGNLEPGDLVTCWDRGEFRVEVHSRAQQGVAELAQKLVTLVRASNLEWWGDPRRVTISVGGAMAERLDTRDSLEARVGQALENCQAGGGDRAAIGHHDGPETGESCLP